jgi:lysophospholipase L1-like esterase
MFWLPSTIIIAAFAMCAGTAPVRAAARFDASSAACSQSGPLPANCGNIVFDGDSISAGAGSSGGQGLDKQFMQELHVRARVANVAVGGRPVSDCLRAYGSLVMPLFAPTARFNLIVFHAGDNDIAQGRDAAETYEAFARYVADAHAQGWKIIVSTELQRLKFPPAKQAALTEYNERLLANAAGTDAVVNLDSDPRMTDPAARGDPALFTGDGVHPSNGGYAILARMLAAAGPRLLPR